MSDLVKHPRSGEPILRRVYADPGRHGWYYRDKKSDSVACYILEADVTAHNQAQGARIERLEAVLLRAVTESTDGPSDLWVPEAHAALKENQGC